MLFQSQSVPMTPILNTCRSQVVLRNRRPLPIGARVRSPSVSSGHDIAARQRHACRSILLTRPVRFLGRLCAVDRHQRPRRLGVRDRQPGEGQSAVGLQFVRVRRL